MNQKKHKQFRRMLKLLYIKQHNRIPDKDELRKIEKKAKKYG